MHEFLYVRCSITAAQVFEKFFNAFCKKLMHFLWHLQFFTSFNYHFLHNFVSEKVNWEFIVVVLQIFPGNLRSFPTSSSLSHSVKNWVLGKVK